MLLQAILSKAEPVESMQTYSSIYSSSQFKSLLQCYIPTEQAAADYVETRLQRAEESKAMI